ncbi:MAG: myo-inosose-2 dehydratase [Candidatus Parvarchaeota archaeon]|nr:myo-inosose-2 dehydratase [Candidatus Jingweiarchaeum tengchongense]
MIKPMDIKLGISPIGWTNDDMPELGSNISFEQSIDEMALAGFEGCEVGNKFPRDTNELKEALQLRNLKIASAWFSSFFTTKDIRETIDKFIKHRDFLYEMGAKVIVVSESGKSIQGEITTPLHSKKPVFDDKDWMNLVNGLHEIGKLAKDKDMKIVYHHHMGTGVQTFGEIERLMELTDPTLVYLLVDTGHIVFSGGDPIQLIKKFGERIKHVHFKDIRKNIMEISIRKDMSFLNSVRLGIFTVPGDGMIDFVPIIKALDDIDYKGWIIVEAEQDPQKANPLEYAIKARRYIKEIAKI